MKILLQKFIDGLVLYDKSGNKFQVKDPKKNGQMINCFLDTKTELGIPKNFLIHQGRIDLEEFSAIITTIMPKNSTLRLVPAPVH